MLRFALDENFPQPIIDSMSPYIPEAQLVSVRSIDSGMEQLDDWELLLALHHHDGRWAGLVSADSNMLQQAKELTVLMQTKLTLIVTEAAGHDPLVASGLLLAHLPALCKEYSEEHSQVFALKVRRTKPTDPWDALQRAAKHQNASAKALYQEKQAKRRGAVAEPAEWRVNLAAQFRRETPGNSRPSRDPNPRGSLCGEALGLYRIIRSRGP